ncbi:hypothetical protein BEN74_04155 [Acinetobacter sp. WCHAc010034]|nr:hypothetical protein BEN74_04155 [Acinetobacter sp. WCHAc010034]
MDIELERKAFEAWHESKYGEHVTWANGAPVSHIHDDRWQGWRAAIAQATQEGFVLVPIESLKVALFWMNEDIDPWQMGSNSFADLFEHKPILEKALVEAQEQDHD